MTWIQPPRLFAVLLAVSVLSAGLPVGAAAAGGSGGSGGFGENTVTVTRGDTVEITVSHSDTATVWIGSERSGFLLEVVLGGSGTDTFTIDTYATTGSPGSFVSGAGSATLHTHQLQRPLAATDYAMNVTVGGVEQDIGRLTVEPREEMNATTRIAPGSLVDDETPGADAVIGSSVERDTVARGDLVVMPVAESGLENALNVDDLDGDGNANGIAVRLTELDPEPNTEAETLVATEDPGLTVLPDLENDRFLVLWDTSTRTLKPHSNHSWRMDVVLTSANGLVETDTTVATTRVQLEAPTVETNGPDHRDFYPWDEATVQVNGTTNLAPGSTLNARAKSLEPPFLAQSDATVGANGTFSTALDLSKAGPGQSVPVWVLGFKDSTKRTVVRYAEQALFSFRDQVSNGEVVLVDSVHLGAGGFVEARVNGSRVGVSEHLSPGTHEDVTVDVDPALDEPRNVTVVARLDRDLDGSFNASTDRAYTRAGTDVDAAVNASAYVRLQGVGTTTTTPTTSTSTATTTATPMTTTTHLAASGPLVERTPIPALAAADSGVNAPFPAWTAVVAVLAGGLLAARHRGDRS